MRVRTSFVQKKSNVSIVLHVEMDIDFSFQNTHYEHWCIFEDFIVGLLADSVMLHDTVYVNIGEQVVLCCPYTSHDLQSQWCGPSNLTVLSF